MLSETAALREPLSSCRDLGIAEHVRLHLMKSTGLAVSFCWLSVHTQKINEIN